MRSIPVSVRSGGEGRLLLDRLWLDIEAARRAIARARPSAIAHTARGLMTTLCNVRVRFELEHAATAFAEGLDERPNAEDFVFFAVAARATLDRAAKSGASSLVRELEELDDSLDHVREAVLLLEPEDYKDALAATPPSSHAWWGERARLDAGLREIDLERVLGDLGPLACDHV
jgi:hypothetical protein